VKLAVHGTDHPHVVELVQHLVAAGAEVGAIVATEAGIGPWLASQYPDARSDNPLGDDIDVVVTAAIPSERAQIAIDAMRAGKDVVADKPGITNGAQLDEVRAVQSETGRRWIVVFGERLGNPAMVWAERQVRAGRIGRVVHTVGLGPHRLTLKHRPVWFFDPARYGGILTDIGAHQVDQFLWFTGSPNAEVVTATVHADDEHPGLQILGEMVLRAPDGRTGYARVDYFTPTGLGTWGDVRFHATGTEGTLEVRSSEHIVTIVNAHEVYTHDASKNPITWARDFINDDMLMTQAHVFAVHDVCLRAQAVGETQGIRTTRPTA
jgi:predicted dehydrogenase